MIYCIWYPSGGFGHFVSSVLNLHGKNFARPKSKLVFSSNGNSHGLDYVAPPYIKNQDFYSFNFDPAVNYSVIVDNGINSEETKFINFFPNSTIIKICYSNYSWPVVANTMISKAMDIELESHVNAQSEWNTESPWAQREKYFLYLRDHPLRHAWKTNSTSKNLFVETLLYYTEFVDMLKSFDIDIDEFEELHHQWRLANYRYFYPVVEASKFINGEPLSHPITDIWTQAVVYYQIWCKYGIEVPHNDYADFFKDQQDFRHWISNK